MKSFDANALSILLFKGSAVPLDFRTNPPSTIHYARERMEHLVKELSQKGERILIPDPSLSEFLVTAVFAGASIQDYLTIIQKAQHFITRPFGVRAAVESAERLAAALKSGDKREGASKTEPWQQLKYDRQIVAISLVEGATEIYTTDRGVYNQALRWGIKPVHVADLAVPPEQLKLIDVSRSKPKSSEPPNVDLPEPPKPDPSKAQAPKKKDHK